MGVIHCCGGLRKSQTFKVLPFDGYLEATFDWLEACPICSHTVCQLTRVDFACNVSSIRRVNLKARKFRDKIRPFLLRSEQSSKTSFSPQNGKFYLYYNEFGVKKKCFSNFSSLKLGLFDSQNLPTSRLLKVDFSLTEPIFGNFALPKSENT